MYLLGKETALKISRIVCSSYYKEMLEFYKNAFVISRRQDIRGSAKQLLSLQLDLAKYETKLWQTLRVGRTKAKELHIKTNLNAQENIELEGIEKNIFIHEQLIRISRTICDGIAWRCLKYKRTFINSAARGCAAGDINVENPDFQSEFEWAFKITEKFGSIVILNDLTHFLRIGDLTEIDGDVIMLHEIKLGKPVQNMFTQKLENGKLLSKQIQRLLELQSVAISDEIKVDGQPIKTTRLNTNVTTNIGKIKNLIRRSEQELIVFEKIEPFITVEVTNFEAMGKTVNLDTEKLKTLSAPLQHSSILIHSSWDSFFSDERGNFLRGMVPYSIFPLKNGDCMKLISGQIMVKTILDIPAFKEALCQHGWEIEDTTESEIDHQLTEYEKSKDSMFTKNVPLYGKTPDEVGLFKVKKGHFTMPMANVLYSRVTTEYMTFESLLSILEESYRLASINQSATAYFPKFNNEEQIWN